jgi:hypothetical protein
MCPSLAGSKSGLIFQACGLFLSSMTSLESQLTNAKLSGKQLSRKTIVIRKFEHLKPWNLERANRPTSYYTWGEDDEEDDDAFVEKKDDQLLDVNIFYANKRIMEWFSGTLETGGLSDWRKGNFLSQAEGHSRSYWSLARKAHGKIRELPDWPQISCVFFCEKLHKKCF